MIKDKKPVTLAEAREILKSSEGEKTKATADFIKKFTKLSSAEALKLKKELMELDIVKLKEEDIVKIIDFMPEDAEDLRKIFSGYDISLEQDEITKILQILKKK
jgi:DNA-directed RNA polymerase subunit F